MIHHKTDGMFNVSIQLFLGIKGNRGNRGQVGLEGQKGEIGSPLYTTLAGISYIKWEVQNVEVEQL